ncbi:5-oxoprolinase subunit B family protein [Corynebacterium glutamicum]|uniref:5-oxoprolinase subunit B family protein n=1 Tax=Corynebacterium glutamicum TaxID=1718 RepID=UPI00094369EC|nr:allophanate hydrolase subunit 1 [Corynebacterium glutamicum]OKX87561.1 allophanate hydrolase [Corynebacterium glutamicum]QDX75209.1 allophanate hydrolase [Corynebacterium glutamicum]QDX77973.1 allophanate hydrolase [Corynebacterium glutamicum]TWS35142.1 allophanate hydrolase [Corynebacterium glutamicum]TWS35409.1 allophanate hydrolase [Corynebacterium glutamicum]
MLVRPCGEQAVIIDLLAEDAEAVQGSILDAVLALNRSLVGMQVPGIIDTVPAAQTLLVTLDTKQITPNRFAEIVDSIALTPAAKGTAELADTIEIPVVYDGPDLETVAQHTGLSVEEVIATHSDTVWTAAFGGFAPGFYYLIPQTPLWDIPRLESPRTKIPAGSVAVAGEFSAVYPQQSPGGWQLLGTTEIPMWDVDRWQPSLLKPGDSVRFVQVKK